MAHADPAGKVTRLLLDWSDGNASALAALLPLVYEELRAMAARHLRRERRAHTLQRTALVHEAFLRLVDQKRVSSHNRAQFLALASQIMRRILVDHARRQLADKRGARAAHLSLEELMAGGDGADELGVPPLSDAGGVDLGMIDAALQRLEKLDPRQGKLVELRYFGGLNTQDTAEVLGVSAATVKREWTSARAWLQRELGSGAPE